MAAGGKAPAASPEAAGSSTAPGPARPCLREAPRPAAGRWQHPVSQRSGWGGGRARGGSLPRLGRGTVKLRLLAALDGLEDVLEVFGAVTRRLAGRVYNAMSKTETVRHV